MSPAKEEQDIAPAAVPRAFVLDCPGCPSGLEIGDQIAWAISRPFALPMQAMHPLQRAAVQAELEAPSGSAVDERRLDLALSWILEAERLGDASRHLLAQTHEGVRPLASKLHPAFARKS